MNRSILVACLLLAAFPRALLGYEYTLTDLGQLDASFGDNIYYARSINERGDVVGHAVGPFPILNTVPFHWTAGSGMQSPSFANCEQRYFLGINDDGLAIGFGGNCTPGGQVPFTWSAANGYRALPKLTGGNPAYPFGINNAGQIVGSAITPSPFAGHPVMWTPNGEIVDLFPMIGNPGEARDINNAGHVVGSFTSAASNPYDRAFVWSAEGGMIDLGVFLPGEGSSANAVNDLGYVVGNAYSFDFGNAFLWTPQDGMRELGALPGADSSIAYDINNHNVLVGDVRYFEAQPGPGSGLGDHAMIYRNGQMFDLNNLVELPPEWQWLVSARSINEAGQIVGYGRYLDTQHAFLLTPIAIPEPSTATAAVFALTLLAARWRKRKHRPHPALPSPLCLPPCSP